MGLTKTSIFDTIKWRRFKCPTSELRLDIVLKCGQSFRWSQQEAETTEGGQQPWIGVLGENVYMLSQTPDAILYKRFPQEDDSSKSSDDEKFLKDYFQLEVNLGSLYKQWARQDPRFAKVGDSFPGIRILRQDPVENLFSFICSSNNNIQRISSMVEKMSVVYGSLIAEDDHGSYYSFPKIEDLARDGVEERLRTMGFGYRASYISKSAKQLADLGGRDYLLELRGQSYSDVRGSLIKLSGIGPKVSDCIALMSLDQHSAVPVDTHVHQVALRYLPHLKSHKSVTDRVYTEISDHFRSLYGSHAGWAQSVLFSSDLKHLQSVESNITGSGIPAQKDHKEKKSVPSKAKRKRK